jgi:hypothetical protein
MAASTTVSKVNANMNSQVQQQMEFINLKLPQSSSNLTVPSGGGGLNTAMSTASSVTTTKRPKFKLEPIKVLEPSNKKLNLPESQRIMFILEELIRKMEMLEYINLMTVSHWDESKLRELLHVNLSDEEKRKNYDQIFVSMCQHHRALLDSYSHGLAEDKNNSSAQTRQSIELLLKNSCKDFIRVFSLNPTFYDAVKSEYAKFKKRQSPQLAELISKARRFLATIN